MPMSVFSNEEISSSTLAVVVVALTVFCWLPFSEAVLTRSGGFLGGKNFGMSDRMVKVGVGNKAEVCLSSGIQP